jgi:GDP/UDP-N,N'-diacetylbacillosamine 2-epimerase (hydrolysing)
MKRKQVLAITGIRSEYFLQRPILRAMMEHPELELGVIVTGAHLSPLHGQTVAAIEADGFPIVERIESLLNSDRDGARLKGAATQLQVLAHVVDSRRPDWLFIAGDREESITFALCGAYLGLAMAHYSAGDRVVGNVDDMVRHATSRLAHLLLTTHEDARQRLIKSGEEEWRVHNVGHSGLDRFRTARVMNPEELASALGVPAVEKRYAVVIQHPLSSQWEQAGAHMNETMAALKELGIQAFISYPNSDPGSNDIIKIIEENRAESNIHIFRNIPDDPFVNLLRNASMLVGNSSLGLLEAPFLKLPAVNVGFRQTNRHHAENVFFVPAQREKIVQQMRAILNDDELQNSIRQCSNPFGDGHTGRRVADLLAATPVDSKLLNKDLTF